MKYKVHIFYNNWKQKELRKEFASSDEALRCALAERIKIHNVFSIIIYKHKWYINNFQKEKGVSILEFFKNIEYTYICIEDFPPIALSLDEMSSDDIGICAPQYEGYELFEAKIIILYSGALNPESIWVLTLHEAGHAITDMKYKLKYENYTVFHELKAWEWCSNQCINIGINDFTLKKLTRECLSSYVHSAINKKGFVKGTGMSQKTFWKKYKILTNLDLSIYDLK